MCVHAFRIFDRRVRKTRARVSYIPSRLPVIMFVQMIAWYRYSVELGLTTVNSYIPISGICWTYVLCWPIYGPPPAGTPHLTLLINLTCTYQLVSLQDFYKLINFHQDKPSLLLVSHLLRHCQIKLTL